MCVFGTIQGQRHPLGPERREDRVDEDPQFPIPPLSELVDHYERLALPPRPAPVVAVALNTRALSEKEARAAVVAAEADTGLPADDPVRVGAASLLDAVLAALPARKGDAAAPEYARKRRKA